jgi:hypothetical protein
MTEPITVQEYEAAERAMAVLESRRGLMVHAAVTVAVSLALILVNVFAAPQFPWSPFPVVGMGIGVLVHYLFGVRRLEPTLRARQTATERHAMHMKGV